jgi:hypothetical protein
LQEARAAARVPEEIGMNRAEFEGLLRDHHVRGVHEELEHLVRGVGKALDNHLTATEAAVGVAVTAYDGRLAELERRVAALERRT